MSLSGESSLSFLLEQPRAAKIVLSMYEGLARTCDQIMASESPDPAIMRSLEKYRRLYIKHVGVDVTERGKLRREVDMRIEQEAASAAD